MRDWKRGDCPPSVLANTPVQAAVEWNVRNREEHTGDIAVQNAIERCTAAQDLLMDQVRAGNVTLIPNDEPVLRAPPSLSTPPSPSDRSTAEPAAPVSACRVLRCCRDPVRAATARVHVV